MKLSRQPRTSGRLDGTGEVVTRDAAISSSLTVTRHCRPPSAGRLGPAVQSNAGVTTRSGTFATSCRMTWQVKAAYNLLGKTAWPSSGNRGTGWPACGNARKRLSPLIAWNCLRPLRRCLRTTNIIGSPHAEFRLRTAGGIEKWCCGGWRQPS